jgi:hypothetical protein
LKREYKNPSKWGRIMLKEGAISHPDRILARRQQPRPSRRGCFLFG